MSSAQGGPAMKFISTLRALGWRFSSHLASENSVSRHVASSSFFSTLGVISLKLCRVIDQRSREDPNGRSEWLSAAEVAHQLAIAGL